MSGVSQQPQGDVKRDDDHDEDKVDHVAEASEIVLAFKDLEFECYINHDEDIDDSLNYDDTPVRGPCSTFDQGPA